LPSKTRVEQALRRASSFTSSAVLPKPELTLCKDVCQKQIMVPADRVQRLHKRDEVTGMSLVPDGSLVKGCWPWFPAPPINRLVGSPPRSVQGDVLALLSWSTAAGTQGIASGTVRKARLPRSVRRRNCCTRCQEAMSTGRLRSNGPCGSVRPSRGNPGAGPGSDPARRPAWWTGRWRVHGVAAPTSPELEHVGRVNAELDTLAVSWRRNECLATALASPPRPLSSQSRLVWALVIVSRVVKVFDETIKRVSAGSRSCTASAKSVASMLDTNRKHGAVAVVFQRLVGHDRTRSEPPMPMFDDVLDALARVACSSHARMRSEKSAIL